VLATAAAGGQNHALEVNHGDPAAERRANPNLECRGKGPLVAEERLQGRHAAAHPALGADRDAAGFGAQPDQPVHRHPDRLDPRRGHHLGDPGLRRVQDPLPLRSRHRDDDPREQLHAVDCHRGRLHDGAAGHQPRGLHDHHREADSPLGDHRLDDQSLDPGRALRVPVETSFHQRRAIPVPRGPCLRHRSRRAA